MIKYTNREAIMFVLVGCIGFMVNTLVLMLMYKKLLFGLLPSQLAAAETAILSNFTLHTKLTYTRAEKTPILRRLGKFHLSSFAGAAITLLILLLATTWLHIYYLIALVLGAAAAMAWNFVINKLIIWKNSNAISPLAVQSKLEI
jgi:putative flippase GtrA